MTLLRSFLVLYILDEKERERDYGFGEMRLSDGYFPLVFKGGIYIYINS